ncbi:signal peptidase I [Sporosarcina sp. E16_8]|uniref:signal peptidase I n=1 Tax=Sporosarcina sp. E16_8 TaxID=2789295 RepID=UPI001A9272E6|nr:signal peptidase I [Sporosarcina sp. E16_8]MBO0586179.1 signal peptidase I [Sporosarcina sp. E16_8]
MKKISIVVIILFLASCSAETIKDENTKPEVMVVETTENTALIEWSSDAMDRGNHDYDTFAHSELVVELSYLDVNRGDVIYYKTPVAVLKRYPQSPEYYIGRVVGLPGETVEIKEGQVFIDDKIVDAFYAKATILGMEEEAYFNRKDTLESVNIESAKEYFATNMDPVKVVEDTVFVLVDQWWRGTDSREFGVLPLDSVEGQVLGYNKNES